MAECHQVVTISGAKRTKTEQIQKTETLAILRLANGFSRILYEITNQRFYFSRLPGSTALATTSNVLAQYLGRRLLTN
jgi:hypothetical protein